MLPACLRPATVSMCRRSLRQSNQQRPDVAQLRCHNQKAGLGIAQNAGLAPQMLLDLGAAERRIDGNRNTARVEDAEECFEECRVRRQHDGDPVACGEAALEQAGRDPAGRLMQIIVSQAGFSTLPMPDAYVRPFAMRPDVMLEDVDQGLGR